MANRAKPVPIQPASLEVPTAAESSEVIEHVKQAKTALCKLSTDKQQWMRNNRGQYIAPIMDACSAGGGKSRKHKKSSKTKSKKTSRHRK